MSDATLGQDQFQPVNRRAGYGDALEMALSAARKGWTLSAGQGLLIIEHYEEKLDESTRRASEDCGSCDDHPCTGGRMTTPNIDLLLSDIEFRQGRAAKMLEVTVYDGDDTRFETVDIVDLIIEVRALQKERDEARRDAARTVTDAMINRGWSLLQTRCIEEDGLLDMVERDDFADAITASLTQEDA